MTEVPQYAYEEVDKKLLEIVSPENIDPLIKFVKIAKKLDDLGILDGIYVLLEPQIIEDLVNTLTTTNLLSNVNDAMSLVTKLVNAFKDASNAVSTNNSNRSVVSLLNELITNEDAKRGLIFLIELLKSLGKSLNNQ